MRQYGRAGNRLGNAQPKSAPTGGNSACSQDAGVSEHHRGIRHIALQEVRPEGAFLRVEDVASEACDGERRARQDARFADVGTDDDGNAASARHLDD